MNRGKSGNNKAREFFGVGHRRCLNGLRSRPQGDGPGQPGGPALQPRVHRDRAHPARAGQGRLRRRRQRAQEPGRGPAQGPPRGRKARQERPGHGHDGQAAADARGPRRSSNTPSRRPATSTTTTSAPSTCCSACSASRTAWRPRCLMNLGLKLEDVREEVLNLLGGVEAKRQPPAIPARGCPGRTPQDGKSKTPALDSFGRDLTELAARAAGPGHRPAQRNRARHPDPLPPHEEQPGAARRSRRRQDRHRRRPGPEDRQARRPRDPGRQAHRRARPGA